MSQAGKVLHLYVEVRSVAEEEGKVPGRGDDGSSHLMLQCPDVLPHSQRSSAYSSRNPSPDLSPIQHHMGGETHSLPLSKTSSRQSGNFRSNAQLQEDALHDSFGQLLEVLTPGMTVPRHHGSLGHIGSSDMDPYQRRVFIPPSSTSSGRLTVPSTPVSGRRYCEVPGVEGNEGRKSVVSFSYIEKANVHNTAARRSSLSHNEPDSPFKEMGSRKALPAHLRKRLSDPMSYNGYLSQSHTCPAQSPAPRGSPYLQRANLDSVARGATYRALEEFGSPELKRRFGGHRFENSSPSLPRQYQPSRCQTWGGSPDLPRSTLTLPCKTQLMELDRTLSRSPVNGLPRSPASNHLCAHTSCWSADPAAKLHSNGPSKPRPWTGDESPRQSSKFHPPLPAGRPTDIQHEVQTNVSPASTSCTPGTSHHSARNANTTNTSQKATDSSSSNKLNLTSRSPYRLSRCSRANDSRGKDGGDKGVKTSGQEQQKPGVGMTKDPTEEVQDHSGGAGPSSHSSSGVTGSLRDSLSPETSSQSSHDTADGGSGMQSDVGSATALSSRSQKIAQAKWEFLFGSQKSRCSKDAPSTTPPTSSSPSPTPPSSLHLKPANQRRGRESEGQKLSHHEVQQIEVELVTADPRGSSPKTGIIRRTLKYSETDLDAVPLRCYRETDLDEVMRAEAAEEADSAFGSNRSVLGNSTFNPADPSPKSRPGGRKEVDGEEEEGDEEDEEEGGVVSWASVRMQGDRQRQKATREEEEVLSLLLKGSPESSDTHGGLKSPISIGKHASTSAGSPPPALAADRSVVCRRHLSVRQRCRQEAARSRSHPHPSLLLHTSVLMSCTTLTLVELICPRAARILKDYNLERLYSCSSSSGVQDNSVQSRSRGASMRLKFIEPLKTSRMVRRDKERKRGRRGQRGEGEEPRRRRRGVLGQTGEEAHTSFPSVLENKPADGREGQDEEQGQRRGGRGKVVKRSRGFKSGRKKRRKQTDQRRRRCWRISLPRRRARCESGRGRVVMARYILCWGGGALEDRYMYASPYPAVYR
ncbi:uncharacterized protein LOC102778377 [Neolamprologus brichardi]|uniref:uncharacterized protein LOC102778377 n=1 Tax=Neolamprologus brichardi TaxID=32507 RepID=UPI001643F910|nr:uncharacterized protein LOC102778377 [Neolamprologus brichardi]